MSLHGDLQLLNLRKWVNFVTCDIRVNDISLDQNHGLAYLSQQVLLKL